MILTKAALQKLLARTAAKVNPPAVPTSLVPKPCEKSDEPPVCDSPEEIIVVQECVTRKDGHSQRSARITQTDNCQQRPRPNIGPRPPVPNSQPTQHNPRIRPLMSLRLPASQRPNFPPTLSPRHPVKAPPPNNNVWHQRMAQTRFPRHSTPPVSRYQSGNKSSIRMDNAYSIFTTRFSVLEGDCWEY